MAEEEQTSIYYASRRTHPDIPHTNGLAMGPLDKMVRGAMVGDKMLLHLTASPMKRLTQAEVVAELERIGCDALVQGTGGQGLNNYFITRRS